jgi:hypothetical protein
VALRRLGARGRARRCMNRLAQMTRLNDVDTQGWPGGILRRISDHPASRLDEMPPWNWKARTITLAACA